MSKKVILLNAPPQSGKDFFGLQVASKLGASVRTFKHPLKEVAAIITGTSNLWFTDDYEKLKDTKLHECFDTTPRELLIKISEDVIKPNFGYDFFGVNLLNRLDDGFNIITDSGFQEELNPIVHSVGAENVLVIQLFRPGYTFAGDSRSYLRKSDNPGVQFWRVESGDPVKTIEEIMGIVNNFVSERCDKGLNT